MSKIEQLYAEWQSLQPLKDEYQQRLNRKFMLEFNYNSNHLEGNTLTYGQTELLLLFGKVTEAANMKDLEDMKASNVGLNMMKEQALSEYPLTETFIRQLHKTLLREDYSVYRQLPGGQQTSYVVHAGVYKTRPNSVRTITGELFEYASPEETPALMTDLISWYHEAEESGQYSLAELCALFHYRYIRIHPFEDGNGRIARLMMNFILLRHNYPMIVVKSADKENYLRALSQCDGFTGTAPSAGAHAEIKDIQPFVAYIENCMERIKFSMDEVWNVLEFVFFPIANEFNKTIDQTANVFRFCQTQSFCQISKTKDWIGGLGLGKVCRGTTNSQIIDFVRNAKSMWYYCELMNPRHPRAVNFEIKKQFYITFFDDHYFVDGILNKDFPYGKYPSEAEKQEIISQFKEDILKELQDKL